MVIRRPLRADKTSAAARSHGPPEPSYDRISIPIKVERRSGERLIPIEVNRSSGSGSYMDSIFSSCRRRSAQSLADNDSWMKKRYSLDEYNEVSRPMQAAAATAFNSNGFRSQDSLGGSTCFTKLELLSSSHGRRRAERPLPPSVLVKSTDMEDSRIFYSAKIVDTVLQGRKDQGYMMTARQIKLLHDQHFGGFWHCIVGRHFAAFVTHDVNTFAYMNHGSLSILVFKSM